MTLNQYPQLHIATHVLSGLVSQDRNRTMADRDEDIDHSLDLAEELVRRFRARKPQSPVPTLEPKPTAGIREEVIDRDQVSFNSMLVERRRKAEGARPAPKPPGRTLH